jgi:hypothetical protein
MSIMAPTSFLNLPAELRNEIYAHVFTSAPKQPHHPWDDGRSCDTYLSLFLNCRQVYSEAFSLLWKDHTQDITLHFDRGDDLESFVQRDLTSRPEFHSARFRLRVIAQDKNNLAAEAEQLVPVVQLLVPHPDIVHSHDTAERRQRWAVDGWKFRLRQSKYRDVDCTDCGEKSGCVAYRATETLTDETGFTRAFFAWDSSLKREEEAQTKSVDFLAALQLDCEIGSLRNGVAFKALPPPFDRARGKVTSECMIVDGRIGGVKLPNPPTDQPDTEGVEDDLNLGIIYVEQTCSGYSHRIRNQQ